MLVWLLISTAASVSFVSNHPMECQAYSDACDLDATCAAQEAMVWSSFDVQMGGALAFVPGFMTLPATDSSDGITSTQMAMFYMAIGAATNNGFAALADSQDISVNYLLSNMYHCECAHTEDCDWKVASGFIAAVGTCAMDTECAADWNTITDEVSDKFDVKFDEDLFAFGVQFPTEGQDDKQYCKLVAAANMMSNAKLLYMATALFGLTNPDADSVLETCGKLFMGGVIGLVAGVAIGVMVVTIIIAVAYCYCCQSKDN